MEKKVIYATIENLDFIYESLRDDLEEQGVLHRFKYSKEDLKKYIFGNKPLAIFLILTINGEPVGFANYSIDHRNFTANSLANLYVNDLFVKKQYRRMKCATLLVDKLKKIAKQKNCGCIEGVVLVENITALKFYKESFQARIISDKLHYMRLDLDT